MRWVKAKSQEGLWRYGKNPNEPEAAHFTEKEVRQLKGRPDVTKPGFYASRRGWGYWVGPFESLDIAKNVALYLDERPPA